MYTQNSLAIDLGASSGRIILSKFDGSSITLQELRRFPHSFITLNTRAYWDFLMLFDQIKTGIANCKEPVSTIGIDTWGTDFGFLDRSGHLLSNPRSYRDLHYSDELLRLFHSEIASEEWLFDHTGVSSMAINPLFKLFLAKKEQDPTLLAADTLLMLPNLFEFYFTGVKHAEFSIASTTQLYDMRKRDWSWPLIDKLGLDRRLFPSVDYAGRNLGNFTSKIVSETGHPETQCISVAGHDTACAVAAVPSAEEQFTFLSSGTWSLLGICCSSPLEGREVYQNALNNEGTHDGKYRPSFSIQGMWLLQEFRRQAAAAGSHYSFADMATLAEASSCSSHIRVEDFEKSTDIKKSVASYCRQTGQQTPESDGELIRCILESLALKYRECYRILKDNGYITWPETLYVVGGGSRNRLLNQLTADALGVPVISGAPEASALGNAAIQLMACKEISGRAQFCEIVKNSFPTEIFEPRPGDYWDYAFAKYSALPRLLR